MGRMQDAPSVNTTGRRYPQQMPADRHRNDGDDDDICMMMRRRRIIIIMMIIMNMGMDLKKVFLTD